MKTLGKNEQYRPMVASQIALILRDLELIDQNRTQKISARFSNLQLSSKRN